MRTSAFLSVSVLHSYNIDPDTEAGPKNFSAEVDGRRPSHQVGLPRCCRTLLGCIGASRRRVIGRLEVAHGTGIFRSRGWTRGQRGRDGVEFYGRERAIKGVTVS